MEHGFIYRTLILKLLGLMVPITLISVVVVKHESGPDFSGDYIDATAYREMMIGSRERPAYARLHLDQSGKKFEGFLAIVDKERTKFKFNITEGFLTDDKFLNLELAYESKTEVSASLLGFGISGPAMTGEITIRSTQPLLEASDVLELDGVSQLGGGAGVLLDLANTMLAAGGQKKVYNKGGSSVEKFYRVSPKVFVR